ncbi:hypothetical protein CC86DRAFT_384095 [Ophiobolus disseminans]|uniref:Zn(2)-C6 fungal-type domain-containing protein n=1 Tax=Ophiobolus disseminans TaxID=1469910 RepID=A0A6A6ZTS5_9PLEO|nr:hypothetical protein CC86DRAFT_384095 [Ophiobolus disseminans]
MANTQIESPAGGAGDVSPPGNGAGTSTNKMRKRTKTGCLTCRKRRIKCGEERPTCGNCIKSKRQCEGYNQRVIFKTPIENWPNHPGHVSTIQYHTSMLPGSRNPPYRPPHPATQAQEISLTSIQPRPLSNYDFGSADPTSSAGHPVPQHIVVGGPHSYSQESSYQQPLPSPHHRQPLVSPHHHAHVATSTSYFPQPSPVHTSPPAQYSHDPNMNFQASPPYAQGQASYHQAPVSYESSHEARPTVSQAMPQHSLYQHQSSNQSEDQASYNSHSSVSPRSDHYTPFAEAQPMAHQYASHPQASLQHIQVSSAGMSQAGTYSYPAAISHADFSHSNYSSVQIPNHDLKPDVKYMPQQQSVLEQPVAVSQAQQTEPLLLLSGFGGDDYASPTQALDEAAVENEDDDYWDVHSDEEMVDVEDGNDDNTMLTSKEFNIIRRIHLENSNELGIRRYDAFIYDGLLTQYKPEYAASPLRNLKTARVFAHYIHVTAPTLSIYERNPRNSTLIFEGPTPAVQQGLWTYVLPLKALSNQGLLHAMLALSSLQIARLQGASITPSYKHYAYSLKRLGRNLGDPKKRLSISTLANSMLLAYYEVWTAEHVKWSTHLVGAAQLLTELDFRSLTREARRLKAAQTAQERQFPYQNPEMLIDQTYFNQRLKESAMMPDESLVSTIVGRQVIYDEFGMILEDNGARHEKKTRLLEKLDLQGFETLQDLYWWYARHDAYQSVISGNPLILPYRKWSDCPPRAPLGRADALYGSHDHAILLLGRITDFTVRDRARKLKQVEADGGWRPRPGMPGFGSMGPPPGASAGPGSQPPTPTTPMGPPFHMQGPPPGWTSPPPAGWRGPPPPGYGPPQAQPPMSVEGNRREQEAPRGTPPSAMPEFFGMAPSGPPAPLPTSYENPNYERSPPTPNAPHPKYNDLPTAYEAAISEWDNMNAAHATVAQILTNAEAFAPLPPDLCPPVPGSNGNMTPFGPALVHRSYDISIIWTLVHLAKIILLRSHPAMPPAAQMAAGVCAQATQPYAMLIGRITAGMQIPMGEDLSPSLGPILTESTLSLFFAGVQFQSPAQREWLITRLLDVDRRTGWASAGIIARGCETSWEKAAAMGRGPPYERRTRRIGEEGPLVLDPMNPQGSSNWRERDGDAFGKGAARGSGQERPSDIRGPRRYDERARNEERGFIVKSRITPWAMNLLGTEEDLRVGMERVGL